MFLSYDFKCGMKKKVVHMVQLSVSLMLSPYFDIFNMESLCFISYKSKKNANVLQQINCKNKLKYKHDSAHYVNIYIYICCARDRGGFFTCTADYPNWPIIAQAKKKSTDYLHWWITHTLCYSTFWWKKRDLKVIHFSLLKVV